MKGTTHILGGMAISAGVASISPIPLVASQTIVILGGGIIGALLPDIDHPNSKISRSNIFTGVTSAAVSNVTGHRGAIHTPIAMIIIAIVLGCFIENPLGYSYSSFLYKGFVMGFLSHLLLDTLSPGGIMWGYPANKKYFSIMSIKTGSGYEFLVKIVLIFLILFILISNKHTLGL